MEKVGEELTKTVRRLEDLRIERDNVEKELRMMTESLTVDEPRLQTVFISFPFFSF